MTQQPTPYVELLDPKDDPQGYAFALMDAGYSLEVVKTYLIA